MHRGAVFLPLAVLLEEGGVSPTEPAWTPDFVYSAEASCPTKSELEPKLPHARGEVRLTLARDTAPKTADQGPGFSGTIELRVQGQAAFVRFLRSASCRDLADALLFAATLHSDGDEPPPPPPAPKAHPPHDPLFASAALDLELGGHVGLMPGLGPQLGLMGEIGVEQRGAFFLPRLRMGLLYSPFASAKSSVMAADFEALLARVELCPAHIGSATFWVAPCARLELGSLVASRRGGVATSRQEFTTNEQSLASAGPSLLLRLNFGAGWFMQGELAGMMPWERPTYMVGYPPIELHRSSAFVPVFALSVGVSTFGR